MTLISHNHFFQRILFFFIVLFFSAIPADSPADFNLSITTPEGISSLRFDRMDTQTSTGKEIRVRVTSTEGQQYQVFQRILEPFVNEKGQFYEEPFLRYYGHAGSNSAGTLYGQAPEYLLNADQLIYTSSQTGASDAFTLIYLVDSMRLKNSGRLNGKILLTLRPIGSGNASQAFLDVFVDSGQEFTADVKSSRGGKMIRLDSSRQDLGQEFVDIQFSGNQGLLKIFQDAAEYPRNDKNDFLPVQAVQFAVEGENRSGINVPGPEFLKNQPVEIYQSSQPQDHLKIRFDLNQDVRNQLTASTYFGKMDYRIETAGYRETFPVQFEIKIEPLFEIHLTSPSGRIHFSHLVPDAPAQFQEIEVAVQSNTGKRYMVVQKVTDILRNSAGQSIDEKFFTAKQEKFPGQPGKVAQEEFTPISAQEEAVYYSDNQGRSARFKIIFRLQPYYGMAAGDYTAILTYSLVQI